MKSPEELLKGNTEEINKILDDMEKIKVEDLSEESKKILDGIKKMPPEEVAKVLKQMLSSAE